jgi:hypothetical protein
MRYVPDREFPPYAFLPRSDPHPTRDPEGHSYGLAEERARYLAADLWRENEPYLWGVDLYNHGYLWEAHEAWESIWHAARRDELQALHLQGLIQCAAACLKVRMAEPRGLASLSKGGTERLERVAAQAGVVFMGLELRPFIVAMRAFAASEPETPDGRPLLELQWG